MGCSIVSSVSFLLAGLARIAFGVTPFPFRVVSCFSVVETRLVLSNAILEDVTGGTWSGSKTVASAMPLTSGGRFAGKVDRLL